MTQHNDVCGLSYDDSVSGLHNVKPDCIILNWKTFDKSQYLRSVICIEGLGKTTKNLSQRESCPGAASNLVPLEYNSRILPIYKPALFKT